MAFCALDDKEIIDAWGADPKKIYRCLDCKGQVRMRKGANKQPHFYHASKAPSCRLYSKSEDHLLIQLQIQKTIPIGEALMERPVPTVNRVADVLWEREKIAFEVQCSMLFEHEAKSRIREYAQAGYRIVWILDDRLFNKRILRPAEEYLRARPCYFARLSRTAPTTFYDQFELFSGKKRIKKGSPLQVRLMDVRSLENPKWPERLPLQIKRRIPHSPICFYGDLIQRALASRRVPIFAAALENWRVLEVHLAKDPPKWGWLAELWDEYIASPYLELLMYICLKGN